MPHDLSFNSAIATDRMALEARTPIFDLPKARLWPIIEQVVGEPLLDFEIAIQQRVQGFPGWAGAKIVPTVSYTTRQKRIGEATLFVKRLNPGAHEALHYNYLAAHALPVAYLHGFLLGPQQEEILFFEYLERTFNAIDPQYAAIRYQFLDLLARFHTLALAPDYASQLSIINPGTHLSAEPSGIILRQIWEAARQGQLGSKLAALCQDNQHYLPQLYHFSQELAKKAAVMEYGLTNGEFGLGLRAGTNQWQLFDLHSIALRPHYTDLTHLFGAPDGLRTVYGLSWRSQHALAAFYLEKLVAYGGPQISLAHLLAETATLWYIQAFKLDWWLELALSGDVIWTTDRKAGRRHCRQQLYLLLNALIAHVTLHKE